MKDMGQTQHMHWSQAWRGINDDASARYIDDVPRGSLLAGWKHGWASSTMRSHSDAKSQSLSYYKIQHEAGLE